MQREYEELINEAKLIVEESETRHNKLLENAEAEKRAKVKNCSRFFHFFTYPEINACPYHLY